MTRLSPSDPSGRQLTVRDPGTAWRPRGEIEVLRDQISAIDRWNSARRVAEAAAQSAARSREARLDLSRRMDISRREHAALVSRTDDHLRASARTLATTAPRRAVLVHRHEWFRERVARSLHERGIHVVAQLDNGADAVGVVIAEQPDLLLVEDSLAMLSGEEVLRSVSTYAPATVSAAQVAHDDRMGALLDAGAHAVWVRRVPPQDVAVQLAQLVGV